MSGTPFGDARPALHQTHGSPVAVDEGLDDEEDAEAGSSPLELEADELERTEEERTLLLVGVVEEDEDEPWWWLLEEEAAALAAEAGAGEEELEVDDDGLL